MSNQLFENYTAPVPIEIGTAGDINASQWEAETFTVSSNHTVSSVKLLVFRKGTLASHVVTVSIKATLGAQPTGSDLCSATYDPVALTTATSGTLIEFVFASPALLISGNTYAIVVRFSSGVTDTANCMGINGTANPGSGVTNEKRNDSANAGSTWTTRGSTFEYFVYGIQNSPPFFTNIV